MDELAKLFVTPTWWISTVIVAFVVNVLAAYSKSWIDRAWGTWSKTRGHKLEQARRVDDMVVSYLIVDPARLVDVRTEAIYYLLRVVLALVAGLFWAAVVRNLLSYTWLPQLAGNTAFVLINFYFTILALQHFRRYRGLRRIVDRCRDSVYSYDQMPLGVIESLVSEGRNSKSWADA